MEAHADIALIPKPIAAGPEMAALARFHTDVTWTGVVKEGGMGPGTPAMTATGWGRPERIQDGRWIVGTGHADVLRGWIDHDRLIFETIGDPPVRLRLVWDATDPANLSWQNEMSISRGPWSLVEEYQCTPVPARRAQGM